MTQVAVGTAAPARAADTPCGHPLATSVARVDRAVKSLSFRMLDVPGYHWPGAPWLRCEHALSDPAFFPWWRRVVAQRLTKQHAVSEKAPVPERTTAGYVLQRYLMIPSYLGGLLFHSARRVPSLMPQQLGFRLDFAELHGIVLRPGRFWCLSGDPQAGHPDATPVPDEATLGTVLRQQVIAHATHFLAVYDLQVRLGRRTQWAAVTDMLDKALLMAGRSFGSSHAGASDARLVLADGEKPLTSASTICQVTDDHGRTHWIRRRGSCCFLYALRGDEQPCASCPRINDAQRAHTLAALDPG